MFPLPPRFQNLQIAPWRCQQFGLDLDDASARQNFRKFVKVESAALEKHLESCRDPDQGPYAIHVRDQLNLVLEHLKLWNYASQQGFPVAINIYEQLRYLDAVEYPVIHSTRSDEAASSAYKEFTILCVGMSMGNVNQVPPTASSTRQVSRTPILIQEERRLQKPVPVFSPNRVFLSGDQPDFALREKSSPVTASGIANENYERTSV